MDERRKLLDDVSLQIPRAGSGSDGSQDGQEAIARYYAMERGFPTSPFPSHWGFLRLLSATAVPPTIGVLSAGFQIAGAI